MRVSRHLVARLLAATLVLMGIWAVAAGWSVRETRSGRIQAERFLTEVVQLQVGTSTVEQVAPLVMKFHAEWKPTNAPLVLPPSFMHSVLCCLRMSHGTSSGMPGPSCRVDFLFDNRWQHWFCFLPGRTPGSPPA